MPTKIKVKPFDREMAVVEGSVNTETREATFTCSSEYPVERTFWTEQGYVEGLEVLIHTPEAADLSRLNSGGSLRDEHWGPQVGATRNAVITEERKAQVTAKYSRNPEVEPLFQDVVDGIRRNVSIRYNPKKIVRTDKMIDGKPVFEVVKWEAIHVAHVADPADPTVGHGRSNEDAKEMEVDFEDRSIIQAKPESERKMIELEEKKKLEAEILERVQAEERKKSEEAISNFQKRETELTAYVEKFGHIEGVREAVKEGREKKQDLQVIGAKVLDLVAEKRQVSESYNPMSHLGLDKRDLKEYSFLRAVAMTMDGTKKDGVEWEAHKALLSRGVSMKHGGVLIPYDVMSRRGLERDQTAGTGSAGGYLVSSTALSFIELLRNKQITEKLGVMRVSGLRDTVYMPKQSGAGTAYWIGEGAATTESALTFGQIAMNPKTVSGLAEISRQLILQSNPSIEALAMKDLAKVLALAADLATIQGLGASGQPLGLTNVSGTGAFTGASMSWANLLDSETDVATANADEATLKFLATPAVRAVLKARVKETGMPEYLWDKDNKVNGYDALVSNQSLAAALIFGDWSQIVVGEWGGLEINTRPSMANPNTGNMEIIGFYSTDVAVRQPTAFSIATSVS